MLVTCAHPPKRRTSRKIARSSRKGLPNGNPLVRQDTTNVDAMTSTPWTNEATMSAQRSQPTTNPITRMTP